MTSKPPKVIFLIEDEPSLVSMYAMVLEKLRCKVVISKTLEEAMKNIKKVVPDIILLDLLIPETAKAPLDFHRRLGFEFLEHVREQKELKRIPVLTLTNLDSVEDRLRAKNLDAKEYWVKANTLPQAIVQRVKDILNL